MKNKYVLIVLYLTIFAEIYTYSEEIDGNDVFVATKDWQVVKKGQKIPKGLHVRINFETGITEAKLLDESDNKDNKLNAVTVPQKFDSIGKVQSTKAAKPSKFKSYEEIKQDLSDINLVPKTDAEVLNGLFGDFKEEQTEGRILKILEDLEYLAHQFDNALEFVRLNGFRSIIYKCMNTSSTDIKSNALILMGALAQNNPKVQIHAVETGALNVLQRGLLDKSNEVRYKTIFALGSVLRRFPWAQSKFLEQGGLASLANALDAGNMKLQLRIVTLLYDFMMEHEFVIGESSDEEKVQQYRNVDLKNRLLELDYCRIVNRLFVDVMTVDRKEFDSISKCVAAMSALARDCRLHYSDDLLNILSKFRRELQSSEEELVKTVTDSIGVILSNVKLKDEL